MKRSAMAAFVVLAAVLAPSAAGQVPTQDSVIGSGVAQAGAGFTFEIDARSGPSGENPTGQVTFRYVADGSIFFNGPVTCLAVNGNFAILNVDTPQFTTVGLEVTDSPSGDLIRGIPTGISRCSPLGAAVDFPVISGNLVVVDAPAPPSSKDQCKHGGWHHLGFKNEQDCTTFVLHPHACAEHAAHTPPFCPARPPTAGLH